MSDGAIIALAGAASPILLSIAALIKAYALGLEVRANAERVLQLTHDANERNARVEHLERREHAADGGKYGGKPEPGEETS